MERLTKRVGAGEAAPVCDFDICEPFIKCGYCKTGMQSGFPRRYERHCNDACILGMMIDRLAAYEDTGLEPEEIREVQAAMAPIPFGRFRDIMEAERAGRLVVLPCKVGDTVYRIFAPVGREPVISAHTLMSVEYIVRWMDKFGKTVFPTREEAERALGRGGFDA